MRVWKISLVSLLVFMVLFGLIFLLSFFDYIMHVPVVDIGIPPLTIDIVVMLLSLAGLVKSLWHILSYGR